MRRYGKIRPRALSPGAAVYLFAPAGAVKEPFKGRGKSLLVEAGFEVICGQSLDETPAPFAAGSPQTRLHDWQAALSLQVGGLLPARGGFGAMQLLGKAPLAETAANSPIWIGSSDCTFLQVPLLQEHGLVHFYGPMPCGQLSDDTEPGRTPYLDTLAGKSPSEWNFAGAQELTDCRAQGELRGGCLSILAALCGTPWQIDGRDSLLILEDIAEHPYRIERMLRQLALAGVFESCRGVILGTFPGCVDGSGDTKLIVRVLEDFFRSLRLAALFGVPVGHGRGALPLPLGVQAILDGNRLQLLESPTL